MQELVELKLPDGQLIWARVEPDMSPRDVGLGSRLLTLDGLEETLRAIATNVRSGLRAARPDETSVEFGLELALGGQGGVVAALVGVGGKATIKVNLKWTAETEEP
ncbi:hypothetical protein Lfu02_40310 [Longispora fulva]|uniref:Trypsin-co-occurring domain-containing protein n=1 Tax=Longispora fulva TaxID=619741 RepID=A0A8J7KJ32_9ACTN|nr:CU044_2847 family protein [Longispora fulva]MBG6136489.1 hypothetical protein [Longispora fulva]GIG59659.1 hypothetical protein Lfu02_40310 [Longispora fulva]